MDLECEHVCLMFMFLLISRNIISTMNLGGDDVLVCTPLSSCPGNKILEDNPVSM